MEVNGDLTDEALAAAFGDRAVRSYPGLLSTESSAMGWAREGAPAGALVVADYQASPRGRGGLPWTVHPGHGLGFTLIARPVLAPEREGWPYVSSLLALHDVVGTRGGGIEWPDTIHGPAGETLASLGVYVELGPSRTEWLTMTVLVVDAEPPRVDRLVEVVQALEKRLAAPPGVVLSDYLAHCTTIGQRRRARLIPMGPGGPEVTGEVVDVLADGALVLLTARGNRVAVPPHNLGMLEEPEGEIRPPETLIGRPELAIPQEAQEPLVKGRDLL